MRSWVSVHCVRRASRGCVDADWGAVLLGAWVGVSEERRVSCRPGTEGAPRARVDVVEGASLECDVVLSVEVAWEVVGTMRIDCGMC